MRVRAGKPQDLFALRRSLSFTPSRDGQRFLILEPAGSDDAAAVPLATVVVNWQAGLKKGVERRGLSESDCATGSGNAGMAVPEKCADMLPANACEENTSQPRLAQPGARLLF